MVTSAPFTYHIMEISPALDILWSQDLWKSRQKPKALHLSDPQLSGVFQHHTKGAEHQQAEGQVSACRSLGMKDQHKDWSLLENTQVGCVAVQGCWVLDRLF